MSWKLILAATIVTVLTGSHWYAHKAGKDSVRQHYATKAIEAERNNREQEHKLTQAKAKAEEDHEKLKRSAHRADSRVQSERDRLLRIIAALDAQHSTSNPSTSCTPDATTPIEREFLGQCASALTAMGRQAGELSLQLSGLQGYVRATCAPGQ